MVKVKVVTAYVDLGLTKRPSVEFHELGRALRDAVLTHADLRTFQDFPFEKCWANELGVEFSANPRAEDRFATAAEQLMSNTVQHSPMQWLEMAFKEDPTPDVFVWMGYTIMKQGKFTGKLITPRVVSEFLHKVSQYQHENGIPIPAIRPDDPIAPFGDNWQFVGSTIIAPRLYLREMFHHYKARLRVFAAQHKAMPLDLAIWPAVVRTSGLPFRPYPAEYDATQLTNY